MSTRAKRESAALQRYVDEVLLEMSSPKDKKKKKKTDRKLYPVVVTDVDKIGNQMKIHYVGYSERCDARRPYDIEDSNPPFQRMESLRIPYSTSLEDRTELVHGELYLAIKENCILVERMIQQLVLKFELSRMCLMKDWQKQGSQGKKEARLSIESTPMRI